MSTPLHDRFQLLVKRAQDEKDPQRQTDKLLGLLFALEEWHFLNRGSKKNPEPTFVELEGEIHMLLFSHPEKADDFTCKRGDRKEKDPLGLISIAPRNAVEYCLQFEEYNCHHFLVDPGNSGFSISFQNTNIFYQEWLKRGGPLSAGYWIPNMTDEEEDFWQEHGL